jgi:hypothetical protein
MTQARPQLPQEATQLEPRRPKTCSSDRSCVRSGDLLVSTLKALKLVVTFGIRL